MGLKAKSLMSAGEKTKACLEVIVAAEHFDGLVYCLTRRMET